MMQRQVPLTLKSLMIMIVFIVAPFAAWGESTDDPGFSEKVTSLGRIPEDYKVVPDSVKYSPDFRHVTYAAYKNNTDNIVRLDDRTSPVYYAVRAGTPRFSISNRHTYIAYISKDADASVVVDWKSDPLLGNVDNFIFSPDGERYAYRVGKNNRQCVVIDGKPGKWYRGIVIKDNFLFSPNSKYFAYVAYRDKSCNLVINETELEHEFELIKDLKFSLDSNHFAYKGRISKKGRSEKWCVVHDNKKHNAYQHIFSLIFSPDAKHLAYVAVKDQKMVLVVDGEERDVHNQIGLPTFTYDSKVLAYSYRSKDKFQVVVDSKPVGPAYSKLYKFYLSFDSSRHAYLAGDNDKWRCVMDGEVGPEYKLIEGFKFSLDSSRYAYSAVTDKGKGMVIIDGETHGPYAAVGAPFFSPDSKHIVFRARREKDGKWGTVLDGVTKGDHYHSIAKYFFSTDSTHFAYAAMVSLDRSIMIVDGVKQCYNEKFNLIDDPYFSPDSNHVVYIAGHGQKKEFHLVVNGHVLPERYGGFFQETPIIFDDANRFHTIGMREPGPEFLLIEVKIPESVRLETELSDL